MSMTENTTEDRKPARKPRHKTATAAPKPSEMEGITVQDCPNACGAKRCVISGVGICAHPHKGGLQAALQTPESLRRLNEAKRILGKARLDLRQS